MAAVEEALGGAGAERRRRRALRARHDRGHERAARGPRRAHRAARHRGLHRPRGARPPGARPSCTGSARAPAAARAGRSCAWRCPSAPVPTACCASSTRTRCASARGARRRSRRWPSACCGASATPSTSSARRRAAPRRRRRRARLHLARDGGGVPRVRALRHDDRRRRGLAAAAPLPRAAHRARAATPACPSRRSCCPAAASPTPGPRPRARVLDGAVRPGRRRGRRGAGRARRGRRRGRRSTWAARRATSRWCSTAAPRSGSGREVGGRALALPMVDVHTVGAGGGSIAWRDAGGALRVGPRSAGRRSRPGLLRPRRHRADRDRRQPACWATSTRPRRWRAASSSTRTPPARAVGRLADELGPGPGRGGRGHRARGRRRDGPGGARGDGRARHRPARARAGRLRRRRPAARRADRRRSWACAGSSRRWPRACCRRSG